MSIVVKLVQEGVHIALPAECCRQANLADVPQQWNTLSLEEVFLQAEDNMSSKDELFVVIVSRHDNRLAAIREAKRLNEEIQSNRMNRQRLSDITSVNINVGLENSNPGSRDQLEDLLSGVSASLPGRSASDLAIMRSILMTLNATIQEIKVRVIALAEDHVESRRNSVRQNEWLQSLTNAFQNSLRQQTTLLAVEAPHGEHDSRTLALPVRNVDDLKDLEAKLSDEAFATTMKNFFLNLREMEEKNFINECLLQLLGKNFDGHINFNGYGGKFPFNSSKCWHLIKVAMGEKQDLRRDPVDSSQTIASKWLRGMRHRGPGKHEQRRESILDNDSESCIEPQTPVTSTPIRKSGKSKKLKTIMVDLDVEAPDSFCTPTITKKWKKTEIDSDKQTSKSNSQDQPEVDVAMEPQCIHI